MTDTPIHFKQAVETALKDYDLDLHELSLVQGNGVSHSHFQLGSSKWLLRVPRLSQMNLTPEAQLILQKAGFERARDSGATPDLLTIIPISQEFPRGALVVERIAGRIPKNPSELPCLARSLAAIHSIPLPQSEIRAPIETLQNPLVSIVQQAETTLKLYLPQTKIGTKARDAIISRLNDVLSMVEDYSELSPEALCVSDTHPGNFIIRPSGDACFVDLEKPVYGCPALDLAHTVIKVAAGWDPDAAMSPNSRERDSFTQAWLESVPDEIADNNAPRIKPFRQAVWLRTIGFFMRWKKESSLKGAWSASRLGTHAAEHFLKHVDNSLKDDAILEASEAWLS
jgi:aminoglycoside phosphotransferase (APT) family kinase protein